MNESDLAGAPLPTPLLAPVTVSWNSPSNIALVKYWGKTGNQLPVNPSVSMTLSASSTITSVTAFPGNTTGGIVMEFMFEGLPNQAFGDRIRTFLSSLTGVFPFLNQLLLKIESSNSFPHSSGIASSASSFSALALCLCSLEEMLLNKTIPDFFQKASYIARLGSGSACRSIYRGINVWGETPALPASTNLYATPALSVHPVFSTLHDAILIVNSGTKKVSSSKGHERMKQHPFAEARVRQAAYNTDRLLKALSEGDVSTFISITENEALTLHALMMASDPGFILMEPETLTVINRIQAFREHTDIPICFTLDAGPNVHLLYFGQNREQVRQLIVEELLKNTKQNKWIDDKSGEGPLRTA